MTVKIKDLAEELGVTKVTVTKYAKEYLGIEPEPRKTIYLTDEQASILAAKINAAPKDPGFFDSTREDEFVELKVENAMLKERVVGLEEKIRLLEERLSVADAALERQQNISGGFWNRLGRKLLGEGKKQQSSSEKPPIATYEE